VCSFNTRPRALHACRWQAYLISSLGIGQTFFVRTSITEASCPSCMQVACLPQFVPYSNDGNLRVRAREHIPDNHDRCSLVRKKNRRNLHVVHTKGLIQHVPLFISALPIWSVYFELTFFVYIVCALPPPFCNFHLPLSIPLKATALPDSHELLIMKYEVLQKVQHSPMPPQTDNKTCRYFCGFTNWVEVSHGLLVSRVRRAIPKEPGKCGAIL
jgi:hypothetical protein